MVDLPVEDTIHSSSNNQGSNMKLFICGPSRSGKDTLAQIFSEKCGMSYKSSSQIALDHFMKDELFNRYGLHYESDEACYMDRFNHRDKWFEIISMFNSSDKTRLSRMVFKDNDIYVGIRSREEFLASRSLANLSVWVEGQFGPSGEDEFYNYLVMEDDCDITITNTGTLDELEEKAEALCRILGVRDGEAKEGDEQGAESMGEKAQRQQGCSGPCRGGSQA